MMAKTARDRSAVIVCILLWAVFSSLAWTAILTKGVTPDEEFHLITGWLTIRHADFRLWENNPPLWQYWVALPLGSDAVSFDPASKAYREVQAGPPKPFWSSLNIAPRLNIARAMCLILAIALAAMISRWAWLLGGPIAAVAATALFAFDPNFLGHAPLVKNDVACALTFTAAAYYLWRCGQQLTWPRALALAVLTGAAIITKFSGLIFLPVLAVALTCRALSPEPWRALNSLIQRRTQKLAAAAVVSLLAAAVSYLMIWSSYLFRFGAGPDGMQIDTQHIEQNIVIYNLQTRLHRNPTRAELNAWQPGLATRAILLAEKTHVIPQAFAAGLLFTQLTDQGEEEAFLWGQHYYGGQWSYFPLAALFKEPLAALAAAMMALGVGIWSRRGIFASHANRWAELALALPAMAYAFAAISSEMNIGYRHVFPVLPFIYIAIGLAAARIWPNSWAKWTLVALAVGLAVETAAAFPDYVAFFNAAFVSRRIELLSDSNFDWGQDLPLLARWQKANPGETLYLDYFGTDDPSRYGLKYVDIRQGVFPMPRGDAVVAVSATLIQLSQYNAWAMTQLAIDFRRPPLAVLGGTIYLFRIPQPGH